MGSVIKWRYPKSAPFLFQWCIGIVVAASVGVRGWNLIGDGISKHTIPVIFFGFCAFESDYLGEGWSASGV